MFSCMAITDLYIERGTDLVENGSTLAVRVSTSCSSV